MDVEWLINAPRLNVCICLETLHSQTLYLFLRFMMQKQTKASKNVPGLFPYISDSNDAFTDASEIQ